MSVPYPPILQSQRESIMAQATAADFTINYTLPRAADLATIQSGHVQILIRRQLSRESWARQDRGIESPDREIIYLPGSVVGATSIVVPSTALRGGFIAGDGSNTEGQMYNIQIRFGTAARFANVTEFGNWRDLQINNRALGEWSNVQRMFVFSGVRDNILPLPYIPNQFLAELRWQYNPVSDDVLSEAQFEYSYTLPGGGTRRETTAVPFESYPGTGGRPGAQGRIYLDIARINIISYTLTLISVNYSVFYVESTIAPFARTGVGGSLIQRRLLGEELEDGALVMTVVPPTAGETRTFRVNNNTLEGLLIDIRTAGTTAYHVRDFSVEMGERYTYYALQGGNSIGGANGRAARNLNFNANSFLTTAIQQLRLSGNVQVRNFNKTTSDSITQTIGGKYPFYSRSGNMSYRVISLSALISLRLDPTRTFLNLSDVDNWLDSDLLFRHNNNVDVVLREEDIFHKEDISRNRRRYQTPETGRHHLDELGPRAETPGPQSRYHDHMGQDTSFRIDSNSAVMRYDPDPTLRIDADSSISIYAERKFREAVMKWLTDGKPKLFRSETEGNLIVMLTGISFSPLREDRLVYSFSATLTEIAEYNLHNLRLYGLIPPDFVGVFAETEDFLANDQVVNSRPFLFVEGSVDPNI